MLFNSYEFIFAFLPLTILLVWLFGRYSSFQAVVCVLVLASLFFYGWWNPAYLAIILVSMVLNYQLGKRLSKKREKITLYIGVFLNLLSLGYFKYTDFVLENVNLLLDSPLPLPNVMLPLAISFFTFQQIAYLVDSYRGETV
ncbi:MAG: MBOAT family protein, partial [Pseudomonadota bacterium]|nr:MBOAT family protein [Pseudomonadota bacterium]